MAAVPKDVQVLGDELAIVWNDGAETYLRLQDLRRLCPCASCAGEAYLLGRLAKPPGRPLTAESFAVAGTVSPGRRAGIQSTVASTRTAVRPWPAGAAVTVS